MSDFGFLGGATPTSTAVSDPIPTGKYRLAITECREIKSDKSSWEGVMVKLTVQEGQQEGRSFNMMFTKYIEPGGGIKSQDQANDMMKRSGNLLAGLLRDAGVTNPSQARFSDAEGKRIIGNVTVTKNKKSGEQENTLKSWAPDKNAPASGGGASTTTLPPGLKNGTGSVDSGQPGAEAAPQAAQNGGSDLDDDLPF